MLRSKKIRYAPKAKSLDVVLRRDRPLRLIFSFVDVVFPREHVLVFISPTNRHYSAFSLHHRLHIYHIKLSTYPLFVKMSMENFILNLASSFMEHVSSAPDVEYLHEMIDQLANHNGVTLRRSREGNSHDSDANNRSSAASSKVNNNSGSVERKGTLSSGTDAASGIRSSQSTEHSLTDASDKANASSEGNLDY